MTNELSPPLDLLAIGAHPDDAELFAGGTLALAARLGWRVGVLDLTRGEAATRGTPETRALEARAAGAVLGLTLRQTLDLGDGDLANTQTNRLALVAALRALRPRLVLAPGPIDRHPDHRRAHELIRDAAFFTNVGGFAADGVQCPGARWLVEALAFFPGNSFHGEDRADWVVDISATFALKLAALQAYQTQFLANKNAPAAEKDENDQPESAQTATYIASPGFWDNIETRAKAWGHRIGVQYGEPFLLDRPAHAAHPLARLIYRPFNDE